MQTNAGVDGRRKSGAERVSAFIAFLARRFLVIASCVDTQIERLDVMTAGTSAPSPSELLGSARMREILALLRDRYDRIVVDSPSLGHATDAAVLAATADGVVLVARVGRTRRRDVTRAVDELRSVEAPIAGLVLNAARTFHASPDLVDVQRTFEKPPA